MVRDRIRGLWQVGDVPYWAAKHRSVESGAGELPFQPVLATLFRDGSQGPVTKNPLPLVTAL
jgi:hypothetical protein